MAGLFRTLFKSKKTKKEEENDENDLFPPCPSRSTTLKSTRSMARFGDDCLLSATAAYHTTGVSQRNRKGPMSCPGGYRYELPEQLKKKSSSRKILGNLATRQDFKIDVDRGESQEKRQSGFKSRYDLQKNCLRSSSQDDVREEDDENDEFGDGRTAMFRRKSQFYLQKWEASEKQRREERRKQEQLERERNNIQNAMSNMAFCMASVQQMEQVKKERDMYKKEMSRYKSKCEKLESKCEQLENNATYSSYQPFIQPSPYQTPQFPAPLSFNYPTQIAQNPVRVGPLSSNFMPPGPFLSRPLHRSTNFLNNDAAPPFLPTRGPSSFALSNSPTTISDGAGESLSNPSDISFLQQRFPQPPQNIMGLISGGGGVSHKYYDDDEDEVKNYRHEHTFPLQSPFSEITQATQSTANTEDV